MSNQVDITNRRGDYSTKEARPMYTEVSAGLVHSFYLLGEIGDASEYADWFHLIRTAQYEDTIYLHINSCGGSLWTGIQLLRVLRECQGTVIVSVEGECVSAATIPLMVADQIEISEHSMFMFHNYSGGTLGKGGEMYSQIQHMHKWSRTMIEDVYHNFLTQDEIDSILKNDDIYMDGEEVIRRIGEKVRLANEEKDATSESCELNTDDELDAESADVEREEDTLSEEEMERENQRKKNPKKTNYRHNKHCW